jgi:hypothetical protein
VRRKIGRTKGRENCSRCWTDRTQRSHERCSSVSRAVRVHSEGFGTQRLLPTRHGDSCGIVTVETLREEMNSLIIKAVAACALLGCRSVIIGIQHS